MKTKVTKKSDQGQDPWAELAKLSSFTTGQLRVLNVHYSTLHRFCVDPETTQEEMAELAGGEEPDGQDTFLTRGGDIGATSESSLDLSFEQYVQCIRTLVTYGTSSQQFEFIFQTYAIESERGISRIELFQMLKDHYKPVVSKAVPSKQTSGTLAVSAPTAETHQFERLYTWLKKYFNVYDRTRCGFLSLCTTLEMLSTHPDAIYHFQLQLEPFVSKLDENNKQDQAKARAAAI